MARPVVGRLTSPINFDSGVLKVSTTTEIDIVVVCRFVSTGNERSTVCRGARSKGIDRRMLKHQKCAHKTSILNFTQRDCIHVKNIIQELVNYQDCYLGRLCINKLVS